jgi:cytidylate kinase
MTHHPALTISRTLGSLGTEVGFLAARQLGWHFCDRRILRLAAEALGQPVASLAHQEEHACGFLEQLSRIFAFGSPESPYTPALDMPIYGRDLYELERKLILRMVEHAPSVIVGRGGFIALKGRPDTLHVRIKADRPFRIKALLDKHQAATPEAAARAIDASDRNRSAFLREITGLDWMDTTPFQLVLDTSRDGVDGCVRQLVEAVRHQNG